METESMVLGLIVGIILGAIGMRVYLQSWLKNNILYKPGTGKIYQYRADITYFDFIGSHFEEKNIPYKFYRYLGYETIREPNKRTLYVYKVEYWD